MQLLSWDDPLAGASINAADKLPILCQHRMYRHSLTIDADITRKILNNSVIDTARINSAQNLPSAHAGRPCTAILIQQCFRFIGQSCCFYDFYEQPTIFFFAVDNCNCLLVLSPKSLKLWFSPISAACDLCILSSFSLLFQKRLFNIAISMYVCLSVCLSVRSHISKVTCQTSRNFLHVACGRGSVLL